MIAPTLRIQLTKEEEIRENSTTADSRKRRGSAPCESSGSDHPPPRRKAKRFNGRMNLKTTRLHPMFPLHDTKVVTRTQRATKTRLPQRSLFSPSKFLPSSPLSAIATSNINPSAAALAALAVITDSIENNNDTSLDLKHMAIISSPSTSRKSPVHEPPLLATSGSYPGCVTFENCIPRQLGSRRRTYQASTHLQKQEGDVTCISKI